MHSLVLLALVGGLARPASSQSRRLEHDGLLAFQSYARAGHLYIARPDGTGARRLTAGLRTDRWPVISPDGKKLAFSRRVGGQFRLFVMNLDGSDLTDLSAKTGLSQVGADAQPDWSPDGTKLLFVRGRDDAAGLAVYDFTSGAVSYLTQQSAVYRALHPRWSPDGMRIAFDGYLPGGSVGIFVANADGSGVTQLTTTPGWEIEPSWSPDGRKLSYVDWTGVNADLMTMNADGSSVRNVTNTPDDSEFEPDWTPKGIYYNLNFGRKTGMYVVQPDGSGKRRLAAPGRILIDPRLTHDGRNLTFSSDTGAVTQIAVARADGTGFRALTHGAVDGDPAWSPDGRQLAFTRSVAPSRSDVFTMGANGRHLRSLTNSRGLNWGPSWSPDGKRIAFVREEAFGAQIWVMRSDGSGARALTTTGSWNVHPSWSPDGTRLVYSGRRNGNDDLYVLDLRTRKERRLTRNRGVDLEPAWSPRGDYIAFSSLRPNMPFRDVFVIQPDGHGLRPVTFGRWDQCTAPSWSPDGLRIVYELYHDFGSFTEVATINADGSEDARAVSPGWDVEMPSWQPVR